MSWLSTLAKIGGVAAAPFTGGASLIPTVLSAAGDIGSVLGKQQQGKSQGQITQAQLQQAQDRNAVDLYQAQQGAQDRAAQTDLQRQQFSQSSGRQGAKDALIAAMMGGYVPASVQGGVSSGGLAASMKDPNIIAALQALGSKAQGARDTAPQFSGGAIMKAPTLTPLPKVDGGGLMSGLASALQIAGAVGPYMTRSPQASVPDLYSAAGLPSTPLGSQVGALSIPDLQRYLATVDDNGDGSNR